jgi:MFS transporter, DHA1 family, multidrug resistance protein
MEEGPEAGPAPRPDEAGPPAEQVSLRLILADRTVRVVLLIVFVIMLGFGIIAPILPLYARSFGVSYGTASLLISAFAFARLLFDPVAGPVVDRYGERVSAIVGVTVVGVSAFLAALATNFPLVVLFRGAGGLGSSLFFAGLYSYLLKTVPSGRMGRTMSVFYGTLNVGVIAGGPIGGILAHLWGLRSPLMVYAGLCLVSALLYVRFMSDPVPLVRGPEPGGAPEATMPLPGMRERLRALLARPGFVTVLVLNMSFFWMVAGGYDTLVPLFAKEGLGLSEVGVGAMFTIAVAAEFLVLYPAGSASDRIGRKPVLLLSLSALAVMTAVVGWATSPVALGVFMAFLGFSSGATAATPSAMLADVVPETGSGSAVGLFRFAGDLGFVLGPLTAGFAAKALGFRGAFAIMAIPVALTLLLVIRTPETLRSRTGRNREVALD